MPHRFGGGSIFAKANAPPPYGDTSYHIKKAGAYGMRPDETDIIFSPSHPLGGSSPKGRALNTSILYQRFLRGLRGTFSKKFP
jgi:hypothetical protein